jgi:hypothetical protein
VPVGLNVNGPNWVWGDPTIGQSGHMARWGFNTIRVNSLIRCWSGQPCNHQNDNLDAIIDEYTAKKYVVMITNHTYGATTGAYLDSQSEADDLAAWWRGIAQRHGNNPYVWFNPVNEPTPHPGSATTDPTGGLDNWQAMSTRLADAITNVAPDAMLVFDGHSTGQDKGTWSCRIAPDFTWPPFRASAAMQRATVLQNRYGRDRVIMSAHAYNQWTGGNTAGSPRNCPGPSSDPFLYWRQDMNYYLDQLQAKGVPLVWGEWGARNPSEEWYLIGGNDAAWMLVEQVAPGQDVKPGALFWHGSGGDDRYLTNTRMTWTQWNGSTSSLNRQGIAFYNYAQAVR